jgi:membrane protease YdiL (CAAX protease family)
MATLGIILVASAALVLWYAILRPDLREQAANLQMTDRMPWLFAGVLFAVVNATLEEVVFRGVLFEALLVELGPKAGLAAQAVLFGMAHLHGIPNGVLGVGMVTVYGLMLGSLRRRAEGLGAPIVAHIFADATIFALVAVNT